MQSAVNSGEPLNTQNRNQQADEHEPATQHWLPETVHRVMPIGHRRATLEQS
jgi:hypothetical protein